MDLVTEVHEISFQALEAAQSAAPERPSSITTAPSLRQSLRRPPSYDAQERSGSGDATFRQALPPLEDLAGGLTHRTIGDGETIEQATSVYVLAVDAPEAPAASVARKTSREGTPQDSAHPIESSDLGTGAHTGAQTFVFALPPVLEDHPDATAAAAAVALEAQPSLLQRKRSRSGPRSMSAVSKQSNSFEGPSAIDGDDVVAPLYEPSHRPSMCALLLAFPCSLQCASNHENNIDSRIMMPSLTAMQCNTALARF